MTTLDIQAQPVSQIQLEQLTVQWVDYEEVEPNTYNPNVMSWHDRILLRQSLLEDGWTQPIVTRPNREIIDGEQRWTVAGMETRPDEVQEIISRMEQRQADGFDVSETILERLRESKRRLEQIVAAGDHPCIAAITGWRVPVSTLDLQDEAHMMVSTIRHNRARGMHQLGDMAAITRDLVKLGLDLNDLEMRLGMDEEEIQRFLQHADRAVNELEAMKQRGRKDAPEATAVQMPMELATDPAAVRELQRSAQQAAAIKQYELAVRAQKAELEAMVRTRVHELEVARGNGPVTQVEKAQIRHQAELELPELEVQHPGVPEMAKFMVLLAPAEYERVVALLGQHQAINLLRYCIAARQHWEQVEAWLVALDEGVPGD